MNSANKDDDEIISNINITPMVDIMLVLLIIFMVTTTFMLMPTIPVKLPRAANVEEPPTQAFALVMNEEGKLFINGQETTPERAEKILREAVSKNPELHGIVAADKSVLYEHVIWMIDLVRGCGVRNFALNVQKME
jgi:biopolymer transport protein ExbD